MIDIERVDSAFTAIVESLTPERFIGLREECRLVSNLIGGVRDRIEEQMPTSYFPDEGEQLEQCPLTPCTDPNGTTA